MSFLIEAGRLIRDKITGSVTDFLYIQFFIMYFPAAITGLCRPDCPHPSQSGPLALLALCDDVIRLYPPGGAFNKPQSFIAEQT